MLFIFSYIDIIIIYYTYEYLKLIKLLVRLSLIKIE